MPHCPTKRHPHTTGRGFHLSHAWQYYLRVYCMLNLKKSTLGTKTQSRTAVAFFAATLLVGGSFTESSAKSLQYHHRHHHHHARAEGASWRDANASIASSSGGHSFSGMASYYGNESGRRTASGQRFNQGAMTCA